MHIVVCAKQIPDPETPPSAFRIDAATNKVVPAQGIAPVLSQFDGIAAEAALRIKEANAGSKVTVISLGADSAAAAIKQVLAMGADEGVLLNDPAFEDGDSYTTAKTLAAAQRALQKVGYVVKPDGVFGSTTRVALEKFERDRGLPVTGQLSGRTVKQLAAQSGVAIP